jgi:RNA polymerase sigma-B factor
MAIRQTADPQVTAQNAATAATAATPIGVPIARPVPAAPVRNAGKTGVVAREGDEQVARWLEEYVRRRDRAGEASAVTGRRTDALSLSELKARVAHHHTPLVESIARRFVSSGEPFEDLVQEGFLGLLSALEHFDTTKAVKFTTYATHFVAGAIRHCLRDRGKIIKEPAWLHELSGKINRTADALTQQLGRPPHPAEIAQVLNLTEEAVEEIQSTRQVFQVAAFAGGSDEGDESMAGLVDPEKIRSDRYVSLHLPIEDRIVLEEASLKLKALEQKVLHEFFYKDHNQTEIAKQLGISCNYVSHILKNSTKKLRKIMGEAEVRDRTRTREGSIIDPATGLYTQAHILARAGEEISRAARAMQKVALLVIAVEGLPRLAGYKRDEAWGVCGDAVRKSVRRMDLAGRFDGDSLLIVLPNTGEQASVVADRLTDVLMATGAAHHVRFTARVGVAIYPDQGRAVRDLLAQAGEEAGIPADESMPVMTPLAQAA